MSTAPYTQGDGTVSVVSPGTDCGCCSGSAPSRCVCMCDADYYTDMTADITVGSPVSGFSLTTQNGIYRLIPAIGAGPGPTYHARTSIVDPGQPCSIPTNNTTPNRGAYNTPTTHSTYSECNIVGWNCYGTEYPTTPPPYGTATLSFTCERGSYDRADDGTVYQESWLWQFYAVADTYQPCPTDVGFVWQQVVYTHQAWYWPPWSPEPIYIANETTTTPNPPGKVLLYCGWLNRAGGSPGVVGFGGEASVIVGTGFYPDAGGPIGPRGDSPAPFIDGVDPTRSQPLGIRGRIGSVYIDGVEQAGSNGEGGMDFAPPLAMAGLVPAQEQPKPDPNSPAERHGLGKAKGCNCGQPNPIAEQQRRERLERWREQRGKR